jgi:hypothetical protein
MGAVSPDGHTTTRPRVRGSPYEFGTMHIAPGPQRGPQLFRGLHACRVDARTVMHKGAGGINATRSSAFACGSMSPAGASRQSTGYAAMEAGTPLVKWTREERVPLGPNEVDVQVNTIGWLGLRVYNVAGFAPCRWAALVN